MGTLGYYIKENSIIPYRGYEWDPKKIVWGRKPYFWPVDFIDQAFENINEVVNARGKFIIENSNGFTRAGIERINESIRTYCWAILGSQSQTRTDILGTGTSFDAQKQFIANIEDAINSPVDLPSQIERYQNTLKYARSKVDFVFGENLYMAPSNMELKIGTTQDYNNEIVVATSSQNLGINNNVNAKPVVVSPETFSGTTTFTQPTQTTIVKPTVQKTEKKKNMKTTKLL